MQLPTKQRYSEQQIVNSSFQEIYQLAAPVFHLRSDSQSMILVLVSFNMVRTSESISNKKVRKKTEKTEQFTNSLLKYILDDNNLLVSSLQPHITAALAEIMIAHNVSDLCTKAPEK